MKNPRLAAGAVALTVAVLVSGCSMTDPNPSPSPTATGLTWQEAKKTTQDVAKRIADQVDAADVASVTQNPKGTLMQCDSETWQWTGFTTVELKEPTKAQSILDDLQAYWAAQHGFTAKPGKDSVDGTPTLDIARGEHEGYLVGLTPDNKGLLISSYSNCFKVPDDVYPGGTF